MTSRVLRDFVPLSTRLYIPLGNTSGTPLKRDHRRSSRIWHITAQSPEYNVSQRSFNHRYAEGWYLLQTWHITFTLYPSANKQLTVTSIGGEDVGGVITNQQCIVTPVHICKNTGDISIHKNMATNQVLFQETRGYFSNLFLTQNASPSFVIVATKTGISNQTRMFS